MKTLKLSLVLVLAVAFLLRGQIQQGGGALMQATLDAINAKVDGPVCTSTLTTNCVPKVSTGPLLLGDGTAAAPTYAFASASGTGIYQSGGILNFNINGSAPAYVNGTGINSRNWYSFTNCSSTAAPAVCGGSSAGSVVIAAAGTTVTVNTSAVTANSNILLTFDSSLSTRLSVTCNTTVPTVYSVSGRVAGTSFTITATSPTTNPACFNYLIFN